MYARDPLLTARRILTITLVAALCSLAIPLPAGAVVTGIVGGNLTDDAAEQDQPDIWRGVAVWQDRSVDPDGDIRGHDWNTDTPFTISDGPAIETFPAVGDEWVAWQDYRNGNSDIYAMDLVTYTETPICTHGSAQAVPDIYQRYVVWHDIRNGNWDIYGYDLVLDMEFPVAGGPGAQQSAAIWGDVVVFQDSASGTSQIAMCDISTGERRIIAPSANGQYSPDICQEWVVWYEEIAGNDGIRGYNLSSEQSLTFYDAGGDQIFPRLDGDWLVFQDQQVDLGDVGFWDVLRRTGSGVFPDTGISRIPAMSHGLATYVLNNGADNEIMIAEPQWTHDVQPLAGDNRYATAGKIALEAWPYGSDDVVIATGRDFPDALGAAALAGHRNVPLLLTDPDHLSPDTADALIDLAVSDDVLVIGGPSAVSDQVLTEIEDLLPGIDTPIQRVWGADRYGTALAIADAVAEVPDGLDEPYGFVCTGANYPDALAASSMAYALDIPVYLVPGDAIPQATIDQMVDNGVTIPIIVGGEAVVSPGVEDALIAEFGESDVWRIWGTNRYETATELAYFALGAFDFGASGACIATGEGFPDALAGGQLAGNRYAPLLLTQSATLSPATADWLDANADLESIRAVTFLGGDVAIAPAVRTSVSALLH